MLHRVAWLLCALLAGCGARTGLDEGAPADASAPPSGMERCDGADDDGDGRIDEGLPPLSCPDCGGDVPSCVDGRANECPPPGGVPEACNAIDDDCDGRIDEGLPFELVGEPIVLRDEDEGSAGSCSRCAHVLRADLVVLDGRLFATWHFDYFGYTTEPTSFVLPLDERGNPIGSPRPLLGVPTTRIRFAPSRDGLTMASFCQRLEDVHDYPRSVFLDADAREVGDVQLREPSDERCTRPPTVTWNGSTHFFVRNLPLALRVETADANGRSLATQRHELEVPNASGLGRWGSDVYVPGFGDAGSGGLALVLHRFDARARLVSTTEVPGSAGSADGAPFAVLLEDPEGLLVVASVMERASDGTERTSWVITRFDPDASTFEETGRFELDHVSADPGIVRRGADDLVGIFPRATRRGPGPTEPLGTEIVHFATDGDILGRWPLSRGEETSDFVARVHAGRVFVIYLREIALRRNRVELVELGCGP